MKYIRQVVIIIIFSFIGEVLRYLLPFPIPASIYGMVLLFVALITGAIKLDWVNEVGKYLIEIMPVMFIPAGVGLMASWGVLKPVLLPVCIITVVTLVVVMVVTGRLSQRLIRTSREKRELYE
ncbi:MAG TPA: CidA/LrgA family protein [Clostridiaceae bacterium]|nr:CidA/LrgA family protein [Clostridiaceae bacterium]